jgi:hypothetical protein
MPTFIKEIDWELLSNQKHTLLCMLDWKEGEDHHMDGLLHLLDAIQDYGEENGLYFPDNKI